MLLSCSDRYPPIDRLTAEDITVMNKVSKDKIGGVSQKGPFVSNSSVVLYELDGNFAQTGRSFQSMTDDRGSFEIKDIELAYRYALLKADGFYLNEITGEESVSQITLYAIADVKDKNSVNVNIMTHLEYHRVQSLIDEGKSVAEAKKQAQREILAVFGINGGSFKDSEDMSIFGDSESDAALLAISVLLQGELSEGSFSALLADLSQKLGKNGTWNNRAKKAEIKEWASSKDLTEIRRNIEGWYMSAYVPDFEKYVGIYVTANSDIGGCSNYNEENEFCYNNRVYGKCGDKDGLGKYDYNPNTHFCHNNYTIAKCGGEEYAPPAEQCNYGVIERRCGGVWYSIQSEFCHDGKIYDKCGGVSAYSPETEKCCGTGKYALATEECCGNSGYSPSTHFCHNNSKVGQKCGTRTETFDPDLYKCNGGKIYLKAKIKDADNNKYDAVLIGTQTWLARNFNYNVSGSKCGNGHILSDGNTSYCNTYGRLYDWSAALGLFPACNSSSCQIQAKHQGICPDGWHIPSDDEWTALINYVGIGNAGIKLKMVDGWNGYSTDDYGFSALPGGFGNFDGGFRDVGDSGYWWSATGSNANHAYYRYMNYDSMFKQESDKSRLYSVRCLQN